MDILSSSSSHHNHLTVPLSPLVQYRHRAGETSNHLKPTASFGVEIPSPRRRHRHEEEDVLQSKFELEVLPYDTASVLTAPSMLSLHSHVEAVASRQEEQEVAK